MTSETEFKHVEGKSAEKIEVDEKREMLKAAGVPLKTKYIVAGFSGCGTHSLTAYLKAQGHVVIHFDSFYYRANRVWKMERQYKGYTPIFITHTPNRFEVTDFDKYISVFSLFHPEVVELDEMKKKSGFPHLNTEEERKASIVRHD